MGANKTWCEATGKCSDTNECCASGDCSVSSCPEGSSIAGLGAPTGIYVGSDECSCNYSGEYYTQNGCEVPESTCTSWTENQCGKGRYCSFPYTNENQIANRNYTDQECWTGMTGGVCAELTGIMIPSTSSENNQMAILTAAGFKNTFVTSEDTMNWWSAASWCVGQGKRLIDVREMECFMGGNPDSLAVAGGDSPIPCCESGKSCQQSAWTGLWDGNTPSNETEVAKFSDKIVALRKIFGGGVYWTISPSYINSQGSCRAYNANLNSGFLTGGARTLLTRFALCE